ncbi:MAG: hypothetical protein GC171_06710 [Terrimonas sp.]|nr:hypothetical protein [Terrimonas sp.]
MNKLKSHTDSHRRNRVLLKIASLVLVTGVLFFSLTLSSCKIYSFNQGRIPDSIKTIKINYIENKAQYVNPQLSPQLTDRLRQKILNQTRLTQTNNTSDAHYEISGSITSYTVTTAGISNQQTATNRLTVGAKITLINHLEPLVSGKNPRDINVSRNFDFDARYSLAQAEAELTDKIISNLVDEIFNNIFSDW